MHRYSNEFPFSIYVYPALFIVAYGLFFMLKAAPFGMGQHITPLIVFTFFGVIVWIYEHCLWLALCRFHEFKVVDFDGEYEGEICAGVVQERSDARLVIRQNWRSIKIAFRSGQATSRSFSAGLVFDRRGFNEIELAYNYFSQGQTIPAHCGTAMIRLDEGGDLVGEYFTEQDRDSFGTIKMKRVKDRKPWLCLIRDR